MTMTCNELKTKKNKFGQKNKIDNLTERSFYQILSMVYAFQFYSWTCME